MSTSWVVRRRAFKIEELLWVLFFLALLAAILLPSLSRARELAKRAVCVSNLRVLGQGQHIYANDHQEWFATHYFEPKYDLKKTPPEHGVRWVGAMGSSETLRITEDTTRKSPDRNHPSRSMFLLINAAINTPKQFICPSSGDAEDTLRNQKDGRSFAGQPGIDRFDFLGYNSISYGYQLPFGPRAKPRQGLDVRMAMMADKGPYYARGEDGLDGTVRDRRSAVQPPAPPAQPQDLFHWRTEQWKPFNSRSHFQEGQNVLFFDGHADFNKTPVCGVNKENIYTIQPDHSVGNMFAGLAPDVQPPIGPLTETDSFIVP